jgi:hypothetical protein
LDLTALNLKMHYECVFLLMYAGVALVCDNIEQELDKPVVFLQLA